MLQKSKPIRSQKLRDSARGEACTLDIPGICNGNPETTVLCHLPDESHGMSRKSDDICTAYGCSACHDAIDNRSNSLSVTDAEMMWYLRRAQNRTLRRMIEKGLIKIA
jgi:hypothetical protein